MDTKQAKLIGTILKLAIAVPGVIMVFLIFKNQSEGVIEASIYLTLAAMIACMAIALLFGIFFFASDIKKKKGMVLGIIGFIGILAVCYSMSTGADLTPEWIEAGITEKESKLSGMGIRAVLVLLGVAVAAAVFSEVSKLIKG